MHKLFHNRSITFETIYTSAVSYLPERSFIKHKTSQTNDFKRPIRSDQHFIKLKGTKQSADDIIYAGRLIIVRSTR